VEESRLFFLSGYKTWGKLRGPKFVHRFHLSKVLALLWEAATDDYVDKKTVKTADILTSVSGIVITGTSRVPILCECSTKVRVRSREHGGCAKTRRVKRAESASLRNQHHRLPRPCQPDRIKWQVTLTLPQLESFFLPSFSFHLAIT
jgi:hypothetical protein